MKGASPQQLRAKFQQMGVLLLLDSPEGLQFGIDNISWEVGNKFKGIKLIPLGSHIIKYSLKSQKFMFPIKKFIYFGPSHKDIRDEQRIRVFKWSTKLQRFISLKGQQAQGYRQGVKKFHFDAYLGPYPQQNIQFWALNTKYITKQVLDKLDPIEYYEDYNEQYTQSKQKVQNEQEKVNIDSDSDGQQGKMQKQVQDLDIQENQQNNPKKQVPQNQNVNAVKKHKDFGGNIYYSQIPRRLTTQLNHTTAINMDRTPILQAILKSSWVNNQFGILGQLQYSFVSFLIGQCLDSYNQWKKLLITFTHSETAFQTHRKLMLQFIVIFYEQIKQFPKDFFYDQLAKDNFLQTCLKSLGSFCKQQSINKKSITRIKKLLELVQEQFGYSPIQQDDESPIIVQQNLSYF